MSNRKTNITLWILFLVLIATAVGQAFFPKYEGNLQVIELIQLIFAVTFAFVHGSVRYGRKGMLFFFIATECVMFGMENFSILTGFPYGHYHYVPGKFMPFIGAVPLSTGLAYFAYGYIAWHVANTLLRRADTRLQSVYNVILLPITASVVMSWWSFVTEPISSTVQNKWIWENSGSYNGVPITNFFGWMLALYLVYQAFSLYLRKKHPRSTAPKASFWLFPTLFYLSYALAVIAASVSVKSEFIRDAVGKSWDVKSIYATAALASTGMIFLAALALTRSLLEKSESPTPLRNEPPKQTSQSVSSHTIEKRPEVPAQSPNLRF